MELRNRIDSLNYTGSSKAIINQEEEKLTNLRGKALITTLDSLYDGK